MKLQQEYNFVKMNTDELRNKYLGDFIAVQGEEVIGTGTHKVKLVKELASQGYTIGTFLVTMITENGFPIQRFHSRVF